MDNALSLLLLAGLGITAGMLSGLFGIGGGMVIVPGLFYLFGLMDLPHAALMHLAGGTSMCIMIFTAASSTWFHHCRGDVHWHIFRAIMGFIGVGVILGCLLANHLSTDWLELVFGLFLLFVSLKMLLDWRVMTKEASPSRLWLTALVGVVIGFKSGILGIGGGAISVPFLLLAGLPISQASGTSASFTLPIALIGTLACLLTPGATEAIPLTTGYIYWPAVCVVAPFTVLGAPLGTHLSHVLPGQRLKVAFALFLLFLGLRLSGSSFGHLLF
ncbi:MAG: sulfite exporter TauE/SafE family protein [Cyanobacteria bacterium Co-bin13]|nr:sulfite exporter TauE/SafE family protein [Cyanobacteria bacterium Co-bin13]